MKRILCFAIVCIILLQAGIVLAEESAVKIEFEKFIYAPNETMTVKISGLTEEQISGGAMIQVAEQRRDHYRSGTYIKAADLVDGVWEVLLPYEIRAYEIRVYSADEYTAETFLGSKLFVLRGSPVLEIVNRTNGISEWAVNQVQEAIFAGLTTEKVVIDFQKNITREEFCELVVNMYENITKTVAEKMPVGTFADTENEWVLKANKLGIVYGVGEGKFNCDAPITRQEIAAMLFRAVKIIAPEKDYSVAQPMVFADDAQIYDWARESVNYFASNGIIAGDGTNFMPLDNCNCEQAIALIKRIYDANR